MAAGAMLLPLTAHTAAPAPPSLIVVGKDVNYRQSAEAKPILLNYHFFAEVFQASQVAGGSAELTDPQGTAVPFRSDGSVLSAGSDREFHSLRELNEQVPNGTYTVRYTQPGAPAITATVKMMSTAAAMADPFRIRLLQDGHEAVPSAIDPTRPLAIQWSSFTKGRADPKGISDDLIFVHVGDCRGRVIARTPAPFSGEAALTYRSASYTVPADMLDRGSVYQISVEQAPVVTSRTEGVPTLATYPATIFLDFKTTGEGGASCPSPPYQMDHGQSDRKPDVAAAKGASTAGAGATGTGTSATTAPGRITGQVTFLYYDDLAAPRRFYGEVLGLAPYLDNEWVTLFHTASGATIGLVKSPNIHASPATKRAVVMVSLITGDVEGWYQKLRRNGGVRIVKAPYDHPGVPIRAFEVEDPAGYPIEFFQWLEPGSGSRGHQSRRAAQHEQ